MSSDLVNPWTERTFQSERDDSERLELVELLRLWTSDKTVWDIMLKELVTPVQLRDFAAMLDITEEGVRSGHPDKGLSLGGLRKLAADLLSSAKIRKRIARALAKEQGMPWKDVDGDLKAMYEELAQ